MKYFNYFLGLGLFLLFFSTSVYAQPAEFTFNSTNSSGGFLGTITLDGVAATSNDWIAAFDEDGNCAGATQLIEAQGSSFANLPIYGDDATTPALDEGINGAEKFTLRLYIASLDAIVDHTDANGDVIQYDGWTNANGAPIPAYSNFTIVYDFKAPTGGIEASLDPFLPVCLNDAPFSLTGGSPAGGTYSGAGVSNGIFDPIAAGAGTHEISYSVADGQGGTSTASQNIVVNTVPNVSFGSNSNSTCTDGGPVALGGGTPTGGTYSGPGVTGNIFDPNVAGLGTHELIYSFTNSQGCTASDTVIMTVTACQPDWEVNPTGSNHTIIILNTVDSDINGNPLAAGDYVGAFYTDDGVEKCAGFTKWQGNSTSFPVYGDDAQTDDKDGFFVDEVFMWKVWQSSTGQESPLHVSYLNGPLYTATDMYQQNGVSGLGSIETTSTVLNQTIQLDKGWNLISTYLDPQNSDLTDIFSAIAPKVDLVKDEVGNAYFPTLDINAIGNWNFTKGYYVRANEATTLSINGTSAIGTPITLPAGWSVMAYLKDSEAPIVNEFNSISASVELVKDVAGNAYIPALGIDNIGNMSPGKGYQVRMMTETSFTYSARLGAPGDFVGANQKPTHYQLSARKGENATLIFPLKSLEELETGTEIGIFNQKDLLVGAAVFEGHQLAITVWGDDDYTQNIDGLQAGETFKLKAWSPESLSEYGLNIELTSAMPTYANDAIWIAKKVSPNFEHQLVLAPNPSKGTAQFYLNLETKADVEITFFDVAGRQIGLRPNETLEAGRHKIIWDEQTLKSGIYLYRLSINDQVLNGKWVVE